VDTLFVWGSLGASLAVLLPLALVAGVVKGTTGFGFAVTFLPVLVLLLRHPGHAIAISIPLSMGMDVLILASSRRYINLPAALPMVLAGLVGVPLGTLVLLALPVDVLKVLISLVIIGAVVLIARGFTLRTRHTTVARTVAGFLSGVMLTSTGVPGPAFTVFLASLRVPKEHFRVTFSSLFLVLQGAALLSFGVAGVMSRQTLGLDLVLLPAALGGFLLASRLLLPRLPPRTFHHLVLILITVGAGLALANALTALLR